MDVANSLHLENDYQDDVTPEGVEFMRRRAAPALEGRTFKLIDSWEWHVPPAQPSQPAGEERE